MDFAPLACSMATRIALYEAGAAAIYHQVDLKTKRLAGGADFRALNPMGQVPVLRTDAGELITENPVVLQTVADRFPDSGLLPQNGIEDLVYFVVRRVVNGVTRRFIERLLWQCRRLQALLDSAGPALRGWRHGALGQPSGGEQERSVRDHPVFRANCEPDYVPGPQQRFPGLRLGVAAGFP